MENKQEWSFIDRSQWPDGQWNDEKADKVVWKDENTGLDCMIHRNPLGAWCGYVGVTESHPYFGHNYSDLEYMEKVIEVHGGLTFSNECQGMEASGKGICHPGDHSPTFWFGFDTAHSTDQVPLAFTRSGTYRTQEYTASEVTKLASQLASLQ
tara:strand:- start:16 stop:474 length:459 start_codon:yes stop_codon:yes gene_type:complete